MLSPVPSTVARLCGGNRKSAGHPAQTSLELSSFWGPVPRKCQTPYQIQPLPCPCRCADAEAYELSQGELSNGIFVTFLKRWLLEDEKITVLLDKVAEGE